MRYTSFVEYSLTEEQYEALRSYFELSLTATTREDDIELISMEPGLRDMLRGLTPGQPETR